MVGCFTLPHQGLAHVDADKQLWRLKSRMALSHIMRHTRFPLVRLRFLRREGESDQSHTHSRSPGIELTRPCCSNEARSYDIDHLNELRVTNSRKAKYWHRSCVNRRLNLLCGKYMPTSILWQIRHFPSNIVTFHGLSFGQRAK